MKVLVFGHSYVRDLQNLGVKCMKYEQQTVEIDYKYFSGANYSTFLSDNSPLLQSIAHKPEVIVVILGGNSISRDVTNFELFKQCRAFYKLLRDNLPHSRIIAAQIELRFYDTPNRFGAPGPEDFRKRRNGLNRFLQSLKLKDNLLIIAGPGRLDNKDYYRDNVHLNHAGLRVYMSILKTTIDYSLKNNRN